MDAETYQRLMKARENWKPTEGKIVPLTELERRQSVHIKELETRLQEAENKATRLKEYVQHHSDCIFFEQGSGDCDCGLQEVLDE